MQFKSPLPILNSGVGEILFPIRGPLTQGTIFGEVRANGYDKCLVHGIVITARCDVANDKVGSYNYLPVVTLSDWLHRDGRVLISERLRAEAEGQLRRVVQQSGNSVSILETESLESVGRVLFPESKKDKAATSLRKQFEENVRKYELAVRALESAPNERVCNELASKAPNLVEGLIKELTGYRLSGHYFLRRIEPGGADPGFVVLLREVAAVPRAAAIRIAAGLDQVAFKSLCQAEPMLSEKMNLGPDDFAMPVGVLASPNIEHLMQSFSLLFGRIGIEDHELSYVKTLWDRQQVMKESL